MNQSTGSISGKVYHCGTLTYTKMGLFALFGWLLWGDFCFTLMERVVPSVLPLKLKDLGCSNWLMSVVMTTVPGVLNMTVCPYVSFKSDRYRSRWGRRIPFILWTLPFLCVSLLLLGWTDDISSLLQRNSALLQEIAPTTVTIALIAVFISVFSFFNMFVGSVFYYLFNDVVPAQFLARFTGAFRIVGAVAGSTYNYFIFGYAESHMREIFLGAALVYLAGIGLMCFMVKEGEYPSTEIQEKAERPGLFQEVRTFFRESFAHRIYWLLFFFYAFGGVSSAIGIFTVFFSRNMGLSLDQIGKLSAVTGIASLLAAYYASIYIDRWHPLRVTVYLSVFGIAGAGMSWVWVFVNLPPDYFFWLSLGGGVIAAFFGAFGIAGSMPLFYKMFPQSRFGQFCSAQAMLSSFIGLGAGIATGFFIDVVRHFCGGSDFAYRFIFIWTTTFALINMSVIVAIYRIWYRLGGDSHFHPPATWSPSGYEEMPQVSIVGPQTRWLNTSFKLFDAIMGLSVVGIIPLLFWMYRAQAGTAFFWHARLHAEPVHYRAKFAARMLRRERGPHGGPAEGGHRGPRPNPRGQASYRYPRHHGRRQLPILAAPHHTALPARADHATRAGIRPADDSHRRLGLRDRRREHRNPLGSGILSQRMESHRRESSGVRMGMAAILAFATAASSVLWIGRQVGAWQCMTLSCLVACVGQVALYRMLGRKPRTLFALPPRLWALAVLGFVFYQSFFIIGMLTARSDAQAVGVGLMNYLWPILTVAFSIFLVPGTRMSARLALALVLALIGLALANSHEIAQAGSGSAVLPILLGGMAGICWGLYSALVARWRGWGQRYATAPAGLLMASAVGAVGCLLTGEWHPIDTRTLLAILYVGLIPNAAGFMLWELALHRAPATTLGLMASATPVLSTLCLLGLFALTGKSPSMPAHWANLLAGAALVAGAVLLVSIQSTAGWCREVPQETNREGRAQHEEV